MKNVCAVVVFVAFMLAAVSGCTTAVGADEARSNAGTAYITAYPSRGQVNFYALSRSGGYQTSHINTYDNSGGKSLGKTIFQGVADILTLGLFSALD